MALREVAPFSEEQWEILMKLKKRGPSEKAIKFYKKSQERFKHLKWDEEE